MMNEYLKPTALLDFESDNIQNLVKSKQWNKLSEKDKIGEIYNFVRDQILFGFNEKDTLPASEILKDSYGQCNTKSILFMALLRAVGIPCRIHGFTINSDLQKGAITGIAYKLMPGELMHTWAEVLYKGKWLNLEGLILDMPFLFSVQEKNKDCKGSFCGYAIATSDMRNPPVTWDESDTYIQKDAILKDFGVFDSPDIFFLKHPQNLNWVKRFIFKTFVRKSMNKNVNRMRKGK
jgi:hypothetical protein